MSSADELLAIIPNLVRAEDVARLAELQTHADKRVQKQVRKAIHQLRSRGIEVPSAEQRSWTASDLKALRGDLEPAAIIDTRAFPGALRVVVSVPDEEEGASLFVGILSPEDHALAFQAYMQTDGQRQRLVKDWGRETGARRIPVAWASARIRWARECTILAGLPVPRALDDSLPHLGDVPSERPVSFVAAQVARMDAAAVRELDGATLERYLAFAGAPMFPPFGSLDGVWAKMEVNEVEQVADGENIDALRNRLDRAARGDETWRATLRGPIANALEDAATMAWLESLDAEAAMLLALASELRVSAEPETVPGADRLLTYQTAAHVRRFAGEQDHAGHDHEHEHEHDHGHVHDENCDHGHHHD